MIDRVLTTREAAGILGRSPITLKAWRRRGVGPAYIRFGRSSPNGRVGYRVDDLVAYLDSQTVRPGVVAGVGT